LSTPPHKSNAGPKRQKAARRAPLNRALSKLGILSRHQAMIAIREGRVRVDGKVVIDPATIVDLDRAGRGRFSVDGAAETSTAPVVWRTILFHKPRGVLTTNRDPQGRRTIYDVLGDEGRGLIAVGRLDLATSGLLLLTTDTRLADWITDPAHGVPRVYVVTARGRVSDVDIATLIAGVGAGRDRLRAHAVLLRKTSSRESHLTVELREGRNREVRRLFEAIGHEVTRLKRVRLGPLELGELAPGRWRALSRKDVHDAFPGAI
jgi:23S rRNA pseudouridine2605 synthase